MIGLMYKEKRFIIRTRLRKEKIDINIPSSRK